MASYISNLQGCLQQVTHPQCLQPTLHYGQYIHQYPMYNMLVNPLQTLFYTYPCTPALQFNNFTSPEWRLTPTEHKRQMDNPIGCDRVLIQGSNMRYITNDTPVNDRQQDSACVPARVPIRPKCVKESKNSSTSSNHNVVSSPELHIASQEISHKHCSSSKKSTITIDGSANPSNAGFNPVKTLRTENRKRKHSPPLSAATQCKSAVTDLSRPESSSPPRKEAGNDFTNLDLLSSVSLLQKASETISDTSESVTSNTQNNISDAHALALGLVPSAATKRPTVWLNVTLQIDTSAKLKQGQPTPQYRSLTTNILTDLYYPPKLSVPSEMVHENIAATASFDERGRLTVLRVEFITAGIYQVDSAQEKLTGKSGCKSVTLTRMESLETFSPKSQYLILGDLCPVPKTFNKCHRNANPLQKKISEYLYSREFQKYTIPLLLETGESDVWTNSLKVPRTRSRVSDYHDLANGEQSLKRKGFGDRSLMPRKKRRSSCLSSASTSPRESPLSSPCPSPIPSLSSVSSSPSLSSSPVMFSDDSCDTTVSRQSDISTGPPILHQEPPHTSVNTVFSQFPPKLDYVGTNILHSAFSNLDSYKNMKEI